MKSIIDMNLLETNVDLSIIFFIIVNKMFSNKGGAPKSSSSSSAPRISHSTIREGYISANTKSVSTSNVHRPSPTYNAEKPGTTFVRKY